MSGPRPVTTKVGGGISPRLASLAAVGVLGAVVLVGLAGRQPAPPNIAQASSRPAPTSSAEISPAPSPAGAQPSASPSRAPALTPPPEPREPVLGAISFGRDKYGVIAHIDDRLYIDVLQEVQPGRFKGSFRVPFPIDSANRYEIKLTQLWSRDERRGGHADIGVWPLYLVPLQEGTQESGPVLQAGMSAQSNLSRVPRAVERGFTIVVRAESRVTYGMVRVEIEFLPRPER